MLNTTQEIISLLTGLLGFISAGVTTFISIKNFKNSFKEKKKEQQWVLIMEIADSAMKEAETLLQDGVSKKMFVLNMVKSSCKAAGIDISEYLDKLNDYIDSTIKFVNDMTKNN